MICCWIVGELELRQLAIDEHVEQARIGLVDHQTDGVVLTEEVLVAEDLQHSFHRQEVARVLDRPRTAAKRADDEHVIRHIVFEIERNRVRQARAELAPDPWIAGEHAEHAAKPADQKGIRGAVLGKLDRLDVRW